MKLHMNTTEGKAGLFFKKPAYYMSYKVELNEEEQALLASHPEIGKMTLATGTFGVASPMELEISTNMAVKGMERSEFASLSRQTDFESALREGCAGLKQHFDRLKEVAGGPTTVEF